MLKSEPRSKLGFRKIERKKKVAEIFVVLLAVLLLLSFQHPISTFCLSFQYFRLFSLTIVQHDDMIR